MPDLHDFVEGLQESFRELYATAHDTPAPPKRSRARQTKAAAAR